MASHSKIRFCIDRGGTFTDVFAEVPQRIAIECSYRGPLSIQLKLLSVDPANYPDAPAEGIRRILENVTGTKMARNKPIETKYIDSIRMGTTVATNNLLERKGERTCLVITKGFRDLLQIGNQARPSLFDLQVRKPGVLYEHVIECDERVILNTFLKGDDGHAEKKPEKIDELYSDAKIVTGLSGDQIRIIKPINLKTLREDLLVAYEKGIRSVAITFAHSYSFQDHEKQAAELAREIGFTQVSASSELMPMVKLVARGVTSVVDAYLTPGIQTYIQGFYGCFDSLIKSVPIYFMQSDGGLAPADQFYGFRAVLSGPAGGVVGFSRTGYERQKKPNALNPDIQISKSPGVLPVIGFDMGGTSTDVSRYDGSYDLVYETQTAGITVQAPQLDINTVAAGGGSRLVIRNGVFYVGPESVGAHPGPVCYRKGGRLAVTDANLVLGRIQPEFFPRIFGPKENEEVDLQGAWNAFQALADEQKLLLTIPNSENTVDDEDRLDDGEKHVTLEKENMTVEQLALGFLRVANEAMCRPIRELSESRGHDPRNHILAVFGGAGGQHSCSIARLLGMKRAFVHKYCGILSAYGMGLADIITEQQEPASLVLAESCVENFRLRHSALKIKAQDYLASLGYTSSVSFIYYLNLRYDGTDTALMIQVPSAEYEKASSSELSALYLKAFIMQYKREFGFALKNRNVLIDDLRVKGIAHSQTLEPSPIASLEPGEDPRSAPYRKTSRVFWETGQHGEWVESKIYHLDDLKAGHIVEGPAIIMMSGGTIVVEPMCTAQVDVEGSVDIYIGDTSATTSIGTEADPVQISIFNNRFMSIAEQMGRSLQRTSISTNIKERLDFSCAIFDPKGGLVANAPHVPVHLGAMSETIRWQLNHWKDDLMPGDVLCSNHPSAGGSHLPDITIITPVFDNYQESSDETGESSVTAGTTRSATPPPKVVFFVASRAHHADVGGKTPGSMPPFSKTLDEEGAAILAMKIVHHYEFQEESVRAALIAPSSVPGCSGARRIEDNISDLKAQIAANQKGIMLLHDLIRSYTLPVVHAYMEHVQSNAATAVRNMIRSLCDKLHPDGNILTLSASDHMDDGTEICLRVSIDRDKASCLFDFSGTGEQVYGNWNAPRAITMAAVIYSLRCLVHEEIPMNEGCLIPVKVSIPPKSILDPADGAAVVGGNVMTSQRVTDIILKAFKAVAASQGCMNNLTFGNQSFGMYETIGGGCGAGPTWHGTSGVQVHMTNTRITDVEILERRFPVVVREFSIRHGSGGRGKYHGGDGLIRHIEFLHEMTANICSERRGPYAPFGMEGGGPGQLGQNWIIRRGAVSNTPELLESESAVAGGDGMLVNMGCKNSVRVGLGDSVRILTPGGGGWGAL